VNNPQFAADPDSTTLCDMPLAAVIEKEQMEACGHKFGVELTRHQCDLVCGSD
jgi:hypothetical protein